MENKDLFASESLVFLTSKVSTEKKPYSKPCLKDLGDLRTLTLGGSPQTFDDSSFGPYI